MGKKSSPKPPDYSQLAQASKEAALISKDIAMDQLDWAREQYDLNRSLLDDVLAIQMPIAIEQWENSVADRERYEQVFQPIEDQLVQEFRDYASPERKTREAGRAMADVARAQDAQRDQALQRLESYGIDPSQTRSAALDANMRSQQAAAMAGAGNAARERVENVGRALRAEAINIGKGLPSQVAASYGQSIAAPNYAMQSANSTYGAGANAMGTPNSWMNTAQTGFGNSANIMNTGYQNQMQNWNADQNASNMFSGGLGQIAGMGISAMLAEGGPADAETMGIPVMAGDGEVDGPGGPKDDAIPARLSDGEYVIPAEVVQVKGTEFFDRLVEKTQKAQGERIANDPKYVNQRPQVHQSPQGPMPYAEGGPATQPVAQPVAQQGPQAPNAQGGYSGMNSWRGAIPAAPAPTAVPNTNQAIPTGPAPAQQQAPRQRSAQWQAIIDKYQSGAHRAPRAARANANQNMIANQGMWYYQPDAPIRSDTVQVDQYVNPGAYRGETLKADQYYAGINRQRSDDAYQQQMREKDPLYERYQKTQQKKYFKYDKHGWRGGDFTWDNATGQYKYNPLSWNKRRAMADQRAWAESQPGWDPNPGGGGQ